MLFIYLFYYFFLFIYFRSSTLITQASWWQHLRLETECTVWSILEFIVRHENERKQQQQQQQNKQPTITTTIANTYLSTFCSNPMTEIRWRSKSNHMWGHIQSQWCLWPSLVKLQIHWSLCVIAEGTVINFMIVTLIFGLIKQGFFFSLYSGPNGSTTKCASNSTRTDWR